MWDKRNFLVGMQNSAATLEENLAVTYKVKHRLSILPSNHTSRYLPK